MVEKHFRIAVNQASMNDGVPVISMCTVHSIRDDCGCSGPSFPKLPCKIQGGVKVYAGWTVYF